MTRTNCAASRRQLDVRDNSRTANTLPAILAYVAATLFLLASGGANLLYGLNKGTDLPSSLVWGAVSIAVTLGAALSWPAFTNTIEARKLGRASMAAIGIIVFTSFSIVAALGSASSVRLDSAKVEQADDVKRTAATKARDAAQKELDGLTLARGERELRPAINTLLAVPGANRCEKRDGEISRKTCAQVDGLEAEIARANRRAELLATIREASATLAAPITTKTANADAKALSGYLQAVGIDVTEDRISRLLVLLSVLVIEVGAGVCLAIGSSLARPADSSLVVDAHQSDTVLSLSAAAVTAEQTAQQTAPAVLHAPTDIVLGEQLQIAAPASGPATTGVLPVNAGENSTARERLLAYVKAQGGTVMGSQRTLAKSVGVSVSRLSAVLRELAVAGAVSVRVGTTGTTVALT